jgi:hypothetical protein
MLKLSMKKLGTPDSDPPSVDGTGGVSIDGDTGFAFALGPGFAGGCAAGELPWAWVTAVRGCDRCVRTSGTGTGVVSVVVVVPVIVV